MVIEFVVNIGCPNESGVIEPLSFVLGNYTSDANFTAFQKLKNDVLDVKKVREVTWVTLGFVSLKGANDFIPLLLMNGNIDWFSNIHYFKKIVGDASSTEVTPVSCGFIDTSRNLRVELENGIVFLRDIE